MTHCQRPAPPFNSPASLVWELTIEDGEIVGVICSDCLTFAQAACDSSREGAHRCAG